MLCRTGSSSMLCWSNSQSAKLIWDLAVLGTVPFSFWVSVCAILMYRGIRMSSKKLTETTQITIVAEGPILPGSISTAKSQCGKPNCACKASPPKLHGTYYRWTGFLKGKRTTKTISKEAAEECERRIKNYRALQGQLDQITEEALENAPWKDL